MRIHPVDLRVVVLGKLKTLFRCTTTPPPISSSVTIRIIIIVIFYHWSILFFASKKKRTTAPPPICRFCFNLAKTLVQTWLKNFFLFLIETIVDSINFTRWIWIISWSKIGHQWPVLFTLFQFFFIIITFTPALAAAGWCFCVKKKNVQNNNNRQLIIVGCGGVVDGAGTGCGGGRLETTPYFVQCVFLLCVSITGFVCAWHVLSAAKKKRNSFLG